jgi:hypothetical protein
LDAFGGEDFGGEEMCIFPFTIYSQYGIDCYKVEKKKVNYRDSNFHKKVIVN